MATKTESKSAAKAKQPTYTVTRPFDWPWHGRESGSKRAKRYNVGDTFEPQDGDAARLTHLTGHLSTDKTD